MSVVYAATQLFLVLLAGRLLAQQAPVFPVKPVQIFPSLGYGPDEWSLLRLTNRSSVAKYARVEVYCAAGKRMQPDHVVTLLPDESSDIRIEEHTAQNELCWARIEDVSKEKPGPPLEASARMERISGNTLQDFPQHVMAPQRRNQWLSPAKAVSNRDLFFLNISGTETALEICSVNARLKCPEGAVPVTTFVKAKQAVVLRIGNLRRPGLLIRSMPTVPCIIGLLGPKIPETREYSAESSITFDEPAEK